MRSSHLPPTFSLPPSVVSLTVSSNSGMLWLDLMQSVPAGRSALNLLRVVDCDGLRDWKRCTTRWGKMYYARECVFARLLEVATTAWKLHQVKQRKIDGRRGLVSTRTR